MADDDQQPAEDASPLCFVIGPIGSAGTDIRKKADMLLNVIIRPVVGEEGRGYQIIRADHISTSGNINRQVIERLHNADLVIADLSDRNPNVFYELGIRHSFKKPAIHMVDLRTELPFDVIPERTISYDTTDWEAICKARTELDNFIVDTRDPSHRVDNPVANALATIDLMSLASETPSDLVANQLSTLTRQVEELGRRLERKDFTVNLSGMKELGQRPEREEVAGGLSGIAMRAYLGRILEEYQRRTGTPHDGPSPSQRPNKPDDDA